MHRVDNLSVYTLDYEGFSLFLEPKRKLEIDRCGEGGYTVGGGDGGEASHSDLKEFAQLSSSWSLPHVEGVL